MLLTRDTVRIPYTRLLTMVKKLQFNSSSTMVEMHQ